jgi:hypothetical protein
MRKVTLEMNEEFNDKQFLEKLGYLVKWAYGSSSKQMVRLVVDEKGNINASYNNGEKETYFMFALRDANGNYSIHG